MFYTTRRVTDVHNLHRTKWHDLYKYFAHNRSTLHAFFCHSLLDKSDNACSSFVRQVQVDLLPVERGWEQELGAWIWRDEWWTSAFDVTWPRGTEDAHWWRARKHCMHKYPASWQTLRKASVLFCAYSCSTEPTDPMYQRLPCNGCSQWLFPASAEYSKCLVDGGASIIKWQLSIAWERMIPMLHRS